MARRRCLAAVLLALCAAAAPAPARAAQSGVAALQVGLRAHALYGGDVDGIYGPATSAGVRRLQARKGIAVDGIAGPQTRRALGWRGRPRLGRRLVTARRRGWDVAAAQFLLARDGFASGALDGIGGPHFDAALRGFQRWAGLGADGVLGPATLAALRRGPPRSPLALRAPVGAAIGDGYGPRGNRWHTGVDYLAGAGTPVGAAGPGCVSSAGYDDGYGKLVIVAHRLGVTSWYAHLSRIAVRPGECLATGQRIGRVGATGDATGPHLHFEVRLRGAALDPRGALR